MSIPSPSKPQAWEPLTPRGVAAFALSPLWRLVLVQFAIAVMAGLVVGWFLQEAWFPVVRAAIEQLPAQGEIRGANLNWFGESPVKLAGNPFLGLAVDLNHSGQLTREGQFQVELGRRDLRIIATPGYAAISYPAGWRLAMNRTEVGPWWGAWEPAILGGAVVVTVLGLMVSWTLLATLYCAPVRMITLYEDRDLSWGQSWRLAGAALMPGALFMTFGIVFYELSSMTLIQLGVVAGLHLLIGWIYLFVSPLFLPQHPKAAKTKGNPFAGGRKR